MKRTAKLFLALCLCLCLSTCAFPEEPPAPDYLSVMLRAVVNGEPEAGREAERQRNQFIESGRLSEPCVSFDELFLLAKFIHSQSDSMWLTDEYRFRIGEVVMNRVASPEFPDSISGVISQEGQFENTSTEELPSLSAAEAALRLLMGERIMRGDVLYASDEAVGEVYAIYSDARMGYTYFCLGK